MKELNCLILLSCLSVLSVTEESDVIGSHEPVHVTVGHDVILPCHLEPPFDVTTLTVEWRWNKVIVHVYRNRKDYLEDQDENFRGRTSLFLDEMIKGNISLKLTNVTEQDEGKYTCFVPKLHSQVRRGFINLTVDTEENRNKGNQTDSDTKTEENENNNNRHHGFFALVVIAAILFIAAIVVTVMWRRRVNKTTGIVMWRRRGNNNLHVGPDGGRPQDLHAGPDGGRPQAPLAGPDGGRPQDPHAGPDGRGRQGAYKLVPVNDPYVGPDGGRPQGQDGREPQEKNEEALRADNVHPDQHAGQDGVEPQEENEGVPMDGNVQPDLGAGQDEVEPQEDEEALRADNVHPDQHAGQDGRGPQEEHEEVPVDGNV